MREQLGDYGRGAPNDPDIDPKRMLFPIEALKSFEKMTPEDIKLLGMDPKFSNPCWMIIRVLAVAPPPVRPSVTNTDGKSSPDDLIKAY